MDHLPAPQNAFSTYPIVRPICLAGTEQNCAFTIRDLSAFGYSKDSFMKQADEVPALNEAAPFLQAWLWFGLLADVFDIVGVPFDHNDFIVNDKTHGYRLSTHALNRHLWYWVATESRTTHDEKSQHAKLINDLLDETFTALQCYTAKYPHEIPTVSMIQDRTAFGPFVEDNASNVLLPVVLLAEALDYAQESIYRDFWQGQNRSWDETLSIREAMIEAGWCIKELKWLTDKLTLSHVTGLVFLNRMNRHALDKNHNGCTLEMHL